MMEKFTLNGTGFIGTCVTNIEVDDVASMRISLSNGGSIAILPSGFFTEPGEEF